MSGSGKGKGKAQEKRAEVVTPTPQRQMTRSNSILKEQAKQEALKAAAKDGQSGGGGNSGTVAVRVPSVMQIAAVPKGGLSVGFVPKDMRAFMPPGLVELVTASTTRDEWLRKLRRAIGIMGFKVRYQNEEFLRALCLIVKPKAENIIEMEKELAVARSYVVCLLDIMSESHEALARLYLNSEIGKAWLARIREACKHKGKREEVTEVELMEFFELNTAEILAIWSPVLSYFDGTYCRTHPEVLEYLKTVSMQLVGIFLRYLTPKGVRQNGLTVTIRHKIFISVDEKSEEYYTGWPGMKKNWEHPRNSAGWVAERDHYEEVREQSAWRVLLARLGGKEDMNTGMESEDEESAGGGEGGGMTEGKYAEYYDAPSKSGPEGECVEIGAGDVLEVGSEDEDGNNEVEIMTWGKMQEGGVIDQELLKDWDRFLPDSEEGRVKTMSAPMTMGGEFPDMEGEIGLVSPEAIKEIFELDQEEREFNEETIAMIRNNIYDKGYAEHISEEAIRIASLGPMGQARYCVQQLLSMARRSDECGMRESQKAAAYRAQAAQVIEEMEATVRARDGYAHWKRESALGEQNLSEARKEKIRRAEYGSRDDNREQGMMKKRAFGEGIGTVKEGRAFAMGNASKKVQMGKQKVRVGYEKGGSAMVLGATGAVGGGVLKSGMGRALWGGGGNREMGDGGVSNASTTTLEAGSAINSPVASRIEHSAKEQFEGAGRDVSGGLSGSGEGSLFIEEEEEEDFMPRG